MRPFPFLAALTLIACRSTDTGGPLDETGDNEDCPGCFDVAALLWDMKAGSQGEAFATVHTASGDRAPMLEVTLAEEQYFDEDEPAPEEHLCGLLFSLVMEPGTTAPSAWRDWSLTPTLADDGCGDLDPDWVAPTFAADLAAYRWEMVAEAVDADLEDWLANAFEDAGNDWTTQGAPYYFGLTTLLDDQDLDAGIGQTHYGRAYAVDADMNIVAEQTGGVLLTTDQIAAGQDGYFEVYGWQFLDARADLP